MRTRPSLLLAALLAAALPSTAFAAAFERVSTAPLRGLVPTVAPERFAAFELDVRELRADLRGGGTVALPAPDGRLVAFELEEAPVMAPGLAAAHPTFKTYAGRGVHDRTATIRMSVTSLGVHASVIAKGYAYYFEPRYRGASRQVVAYDRRALAAPAELHVKHDPVGEDHEHTAERAAAGATAAGGAPVPLRTYDLALVSPPSYSLNSGAADGLDPEAADYLERLRERTTAAKVALMTRVNQIYEADFGVRMLLADGTDKTNLVTAAEATGTNGPCGVAACFTAAQIASCSSGGLTRNVFVAGMLVGARNYDIGHLALGTDGGGIAQLGVVGQTNKARGCTGLARPIGDFFAVDYVAHEMGHQFGGNHTFNGVTGSCLALNRNRTGATAEEPGSGSSVMAYAGICWADDLQAHTDPYFSQSSVEEMGAYIRGAESALSSVQQVALVGFDGSDTVTLGYGDRSSAPLVRGGDFTSAAVKAAIEALLPAGGTVAVTGIDGGTFGDAGFQVAFGGTLASREVELLTAAASGATALVGETVKGGATTRGGSTVTDSGNTAPVVTAPARHMIPVRTPFTLTAQGADADGDPLVYLWEQNDPGPPAAGDPLLSNAKHSGPLFRIFGEAARFADPDDTYEYNSPGENLATGDPARSFPDVLQVAADNTNALTGTCPPADPVLTTPAPEITDCYSELLPTGSWVGIDPATPGELHFRVTARDNHPGAGGSAHADVALQTVPAAGPFRVLGPAPDGEPKTITALWNPAGTDVLLGISEVKVSLSLDGGRTFPHVLAAATPNDGNQTLALPAVRSSTARLKVEAVGNVFFDVSHADLVVDGTR